MKKQILVVEDERDMQFILANILKEKGYETIITEDGHSALKEVKKGSVNLVLLDLRLPGMDGMKVLEKIREIDKDLDKKGTVLKGTGYFFCANCPRVKTVLFPAEKVAWPHFSIKAYFDLTQTKSSLFHHLQ